MSVADWTGASYLGKKEYVVHHMPLQSPAYISEAAVYTTCESPAVLSLPIYKILECFGLSSRLGR